MEQYRFEVQKIEVNGATILAFVNGMGVFKKKAIEILSSYGINDIQPDEWYPAQSYLNAFKVISEKLGDKVVRQMGKNIPKSAKWPSGIKDIESALASIDIAYHINHRKNGKPLFDPDTGKIEEGIGHYRFEKIDDHSAKIICDSPYPCDFDMGIIEAVANKFRPQGKTVKITHEENACRKRGDKACTYIITW